MRIALGKKIVTIFLSWLVVFVLIACGESTTFSTTTAATTTAATTTADPGTTAMTATTTRYVTAISLLNPLPDPVYADDFAYSNIIVVIHYSDETTAQTPLTMAMLSADDIALLASPGIHAVTVRHEGCEALLTVEILEVEELPVNLYFNLNGGWLEEGVAFAFQGLQDDSIVTLPTPTQQGHVFLGWFEDPEFMQGPFVGSYQVLSDTQLYASWEPDDSAIAASLDELIFGTNHTLSTLVTYSESYSISRVDQIVFQTSLLGDDAVKTSVRTIFIMPGENPDILIEQDFRSSILIDGYLYTYLVENGQPYGSFHCVNTMNRGVQGGAQTEDSPFALLNLADFVRREGEYVYDYLPSGDELIDFAYAIYDGAFVVEQVFAVYFGETGTLSVGIPLTPYDAGTQGWDSIISIEYVLSEIDSTVATFPLEDVAETVVQEMAAIFQDRVATLFPTATSLAEFQLLLNAAQIEILSIAGVPELYDLYQTLLVQFIEFPLITDPLVLMKAAAAVQLETQWSVLSAVATDASLAVMTAEYETTLAEIDAAITEQEVGDLWSAGWEAVQLLFVEDSAKAVFHQRQTDYYGNLLQFEILIGLTVSGSDPGYDALQAALDDALGTIAGLAYPADPSSTYALIKGDLLALYNDCTIFGLNAYQNHALWIVDQVFFTHATSQQADIWEHLNLLAAKREDARAAILAATETEIAWNILMVYLQDCRDIVIDVQRDGCLDAFFNTFNAFYYRVDSSYAGTFANDYIVLRDRMDDAVLLATVQILQMQFLDYLDNAVLDDVKNAGRDAIETIQAYLLTHNLIATQESRTDLYNAMNTAYNAIYAATNLGDVQTALAECLETFDAVYIEDAAKAAIANARIALTAVLESYLQFYAQFATDYYAFDEVLLVGRDYLMNVPGQYTLAELDAHLAAFYTEVAALGFVPDAERVETYRIACMEEADDWMALLETVPPDIQTGYDLAMSVMTTTSDPMAIRDALNAFIALVQAAL